MKSFGGILLGRLGWPAEATELVDGHRSIRGTWIPACAGMTGPSVVSLPLMN